MALIHVCAHRAANLPSGDDSWNPLSHFQRPDAYVELSLRLANVRVSNIYRSSRIDNNYNPQWNFCRDLSLLSQHSNLLRSQLNLRIEVRDHDYIGTDSLGSSYLAATYSGSANLAL